MKYIIDTHTFIWFNKGSENLSKLSRQIIENDGNEIFISIVSLWEMSIKISLGKLKIEMPYENIIDDVYGANMQIISLDFVHTVIQNKLPFHHKDPFDLIIASQALSEKMDLISNDEVFDEYFTNSKIRRVW